MSSFLESLAAMQPIPRRYQLFISHAWDYKGDYERLIELLNGYPFLSGQPQRARGQAASDPPALTKIISIPRAPIGRKDIQSGLPAGPRRHVRRTEGWIQSEIEAAKAFHKPVIAVEPRGSERFPDALVQSADERVGWNSTSIISAIRRCASPATNDLSLLFGEHSSTGWSR